MAADKLAIDKPLTEEEQRKGAALLLAKLGEIVPPLRAEFARSFERWDLRPSEDYVGKVSYCGDKVNAPTRRTRTTLGRFLYRTAGFSQDKVIDQAVSAALAAVAPLYPMREQFRELRGNDLLAAYKDGIGATSCMSGNNATIQDQLAFYAENPDQVCLLVWRGTAGRALLWTADDGRRYIDRVYAGDLVQAQTAFVNYGKATFGDTLAGVYNVQPVKSEFIISMAEDTAAKPPYFDSFQLWRSAEHGAILMVGATPCKDCGNTRPKWHYDSVMEKKPGIGKGICGSCATAYNPCSLCATWGMRDFVAVSDVNGKAGRVCRRCRELRLVRCTACQAYTAAEDAVTIDRRGEVGAVRLCGCCLRALSKKVLLKWEPKKQLIFA